MFESSPGLWTCLEWVIEMIAWLLSFCALRNMIIYFERHHFDNNKTFAEHLHLSSKFYCSRSHLFLFQIVSRPSPLNKNCIISEANIFFTFFFYKKRGHNKLRFICFYCQNLNGSAATVVWMKFRELDSSNEMFWIDLSSFIIIIVKCELWIDCLILSHKICEPFTIELECF